MADGDEKSMKELFLNYYRPLVFFASHILHAQEDAEDVVSQVLGKLWDHREQLRSVKQPKAFLYATVKNACLDLLRQQVKFRRQDVPDTFWTAAPDDSDLSLEATKAEVIKIIHQQIDALPDKCRQVFVLSYMEGLSAQQVADRMGISVSNVTSQRSRAIQLLKKSILDKRIWAFFTLLFRQI